MAAATVTVTRATVTDMAFALAAMRLVQNQLVAALRPIAERGEISAEIINNAKAAIKAAERQGA